MEMLFVLLLGYVVYIHIKLNRVTQDLKILHKGVPLVNTPIKSSAQPLYAPGAVVPELYTQKTRGEHSTAQESGVPPPMYVAKESAFSAWIKEDFLVKLGALLLLIAFGWFVNYAFANNWIGPIGRIALGLILGVSIMVLGVWRIQTKIHQGSIFTVLGSTVILMTVFAARGIYEFFTPATALVLMFMSIVFVAFVSVRYKREQLALAGLILAAIAPFITNSPDTEALLLLSYLLVVVLGTLWVVRLTGSNVLTFAAVIVSLLYSTLFWIDGNAEEKLIGLLFAFVLTTIFFVANVVGISRRQMPEARQGQIATALLTGLYIILWITFAAPDQWQSMLYVAWMLVFSSGAFVVYSHTRYRVPFYIYSAVSIGLLAAATAAELDGALLTIAYSIEAAAIVWISALLLRDIRLSEKLCTLFAVPVVMSLGHMASRSWNEGFLHADFFALTILALSLIAVSLMLYKIPQDSEHTSKTSVVMSVLGIVYLLIIVWLVSHSIMNDDTATTISLIIYTVLGLAFVIRGKLESDKSVLMMGSVLLGLVVARLLLVDVWQMELFGRVITFGAIGILLISTAFIGRGEKKQESNILHE